VTLPDPAAWPVENQLPDESTDLLAERVRATPAATAIVDTDREQTWTCEAFDRRVDAWCAGLQRVLDFDGRRIGLLLSTGVDFATAYFALCRRNATVVALNRQESTDTLAMQASEAELDGLICSADTEATAVDIAPEGATVVSTATPTSDGVVAHEPVADADVASLSAGPDTERLVLFTSGTTGDPKGVRLTRGNLLASAVGSAERLGVEPGDRWLVCLPTYHMGGLAPLVRSTLYGTTTVLQRGFDAEGTAAVLRDRSVTGVSLVPTMLQRLLDDGWTPADPLRFVLLGGAPARPALVERCQAADVPVFPTYGTTETASQITTATPEEAFDDPETVGRPLDGTTVSVLDDGGVCEPGSVGELVVAGPTVAPGYLDDAQTTAAFGETGFHTGDVGYRDERGRFFVVGRVDDQIVTGGENVQPAGVARTLEGHPAVESAVVVGLPDEEWGQRVTAMVVRTGENLSAERLIEWSRDRLAAFAVPKTITFVDELPRTASGTVDREQARNLVADQRADSD
jgi:O-succinylbenzoic acid--CoA ligase